MRQIHSPGHFGEWLQGRLGPDGPVALITLPAPGFGVQAFHRPAARGLVLDAPGLKGARAQVFLARLGLQLWGHVRLRPIAAPGLGTGVSTASLIALARLAGWRGSPLRLAGACLRSEGASDPLMFAAPERLLWASRQGRALAPMPALPPYEILGGFVGGPVWTDPAETDFPDIGDLVQDWARARRLGDFAALASENALRRGGDVPLDIVAKLGALGWMRAHTGAARGLIFAPGSVPAGAARLLRAAGWQGICRITGGQG